MMMRMGHISQTGAPGTRSPRLTGWHCLAHPEEGDHRKPQPGDLRTPRVDCRDVLRIHARQWQQREPAQNNAPPSGDDQSQCAPCFAPAVHYQRSSRAVRATKQAHRISRRSAYAASQCLHRAAAGYIRMGILSWASLTALGPSSFCTVRASARPWRKGRSPPAQRGMGFHRPRDDNAPDHDTAPRRPMPP